MPVTVADSVGPRCRRLSRLQSGAGEPRVGCKRDQLARQGPSPGGLRLWPAAPGRDARLSASGARVDPSSLASGSRLQPSLDLPSERRLRVSSTDLSSLRLALPHLSRRGRLFLVLPQMISSSASSTVYSVAPKRSRRFGSEWPPFELNF